jgi:hypothetical protein
MPSPAGPIAWQTDYQAAVSQARDTRRMILVYFHKRD